MLKIIGWILFFVLEFASVGLLFRAAYFNPNHLPPDVVKVVWKLGITWLLMIFAIAYAALSERRRRLSNQ